MSYLTIDPKYLALTLASLMFFGAWVFFWLGCVETRMSYERGERVGKESGAAKGRTIGDMQEYARGCRYGLETGRREGYEQGKRDALPFRASNGQFIGRAG
jgi:hypothetical protein